MCLHICYWGSIHTDSIHNAVIVIKMVYRSYCFRYARIMTSTWTMELSTMAKWRWFWGFESKSRIEFVSNVIETYQHYNCGHYQDKHTKESGL